MSEHPIYFERTSDGEQWPACGCGAVQLMTDGRSADEWITAHHIWKGVSHVQAIEALARVIALADEWERQGENDMACSKEILDEEIGIALLTEGASMVENARHIRNAIKGQS